MSSVLISISKSICYQLLVFPLQVYSQLNYDFTMRILMKIARMPLADASIAGFIRLCFRHVRIYSLHYVPAYFFFRQ